MKRLMIFSVILIAMIIGRGGGLLAETYTSITDDLEGCTPMPAALDALVSDLLVSVTKVEVEEWPEGENFYYVFTPNWVEPKVGFIIYPGGLAVPEAYAPPAHTIAAQGFLAIVVKMPDDLAIFGYERAGQVISDNSGIERWILGGHSLGGVAACGYAKRFPDAVDGIVLWASYPASNDSLKEAEIKVISIYGTKDRGVKDFEASAQYLPPDTQWVIMQGGNHSQFAYCEGELAEDDIPDISLDEQQRQIIEATIEFLGQFQENQCVATYLLGGNHTPLAVLRQFRDTTLVQSVLGRKLVSFYYQRSEGAIRVLERHSIIKSSARRLLLSLVPVLEFFMA